MLRADVIQREGERGFGILLYIGGRGQSMGSFGWFYDIFGYLKFRKIVETSGKTYPPSLSAVPGACRNIQIYNNITVGNYSRI